MHCPFEVVNQYRRLNTILLSTVLRKINFLLPAPVRTVMFSGVGLADINGKKLKTLLSIAAVEFVERRDLAYKRGSRNAAELE